jgi:hypothetical protein
MSKLRSCIIGAIGMCVIGVAIPTAALAENAPCTKSVLCEKAGVAYRDDLLFGAVTTEAHSVVEGEAAKRKVTGGFGESFLLKNTAGKIRQTHSGSSSELITIEKNNGSFGIQVDENPATSATECHKATGWVTWARNSLSGLGALMSVAPYKPKEGHGGIGPWPVKIYSASAACGAKAGEVLIEGVAFSLAPGTYPTTTGTLTGTWVQPKIEGKEGCAGGEGGIKLNHAQPGIVAKRVSGEELVTEIDGGEATTSAYLCDSTTGGVWED